MATFRRKIADKMVKQQTKKRKSAKKKFFEIKVPLTATEIHLYDYSPEDMENKMLKIDLTRSLKGKNIELKARVKIEKGELIGEPVSIELLSAGIRRIMRKGTDYIEDSFEAECKDSVLLVKPFLITRKRVSNAIKKELRNQARKNLLAKIKIRNTSELFSETMTNKLQKELSQKLKKIYPLSMCEIRRLEVKERKNARKSLEKTKETKE